MKDLHPEITCCISNCTKYLITGICQRMKIGMNLHFQSDATSNSLE